MRWEAYEHHCAKAQPRPLRITCRLAAPLAGETPYVHLDALLTMAAVHVAHHRGAHRPYAPTSSDRLAEIPLPIAKHDDGVFCCSALWAPDDTRSQDVAWSQRPPFEYGHLLKARQVPNQGKTRQRREPLRVWPAIMLTAELLADPRHLRRLLAAIPAVGKKRSQGYGRVDSWGIDDSLHPDGWMARDGIARRPLPHPDGAMIGVRPPYWYRPWWQPGIRPGEPIPG